MLDVSAIAHAIAGSISALPHKWGTGTVGYLGTGKVAGPDGRRYQVQANVWIVGSKADPNYPMPEQSTSLAPILHAVGLTPRTWATGTSGLYGTGKVEVNGLRCQVQVNVFEIGSKAK